MQHVTFLLKYKVVVGQPVITKLIYSPKEFYNQLLDSPHLPALEIRCNLIHLPLNLGCP